MADALHRTRPAFEKLLIGPVMVFGEMITGGHYLVRTEIVRLGRPVSLPGERKNTNTSPVFQEVLRLGKQMAVGREAAPSYWNLHTSFIEQSGFVGAFYRGFMPWGLIQCAKGVPVLFVQHESMYQLRARAGWSKNSAEKASGFLGGFSQAIFVNPFQKVKVSVVACEHMNALSPIQAFKTVIERHGFLSLYDGVVPMIMRRSLDWGIRFGVSNEVKNWVLDQKFANGELPKLTNLELLACGVIGGAASGGITHPIDNVITNSQKPLLWHNARRDVISVVRRMYRESGHHAFTRGWAVKIVDNVSAAALSSCAVKVTWHPWLRSTMCSLFAPVVPYGKE